MALFLGPNHPPLPFLSGCLQDHALSVITSLLGVQFPLFPLPRCTTKSFRLNCNLPLDRCPPRAATWSWVPRGLTAGPPMHSQTCSPHHCSDNALALSLPGPPQAPSAVVTLGLSSREGSDTKDDFLLCETLLCQPLGRWDALMLYLPHLPCIHQGHCFLPSTGPVLSLTSCTFCANVPSSQKSSSAPLASPFHSLLFMLICLHSTYHSLHHMFVYP